MKQSRIVRAIEDLVGTEAAEDIVFQFDKLRRDAITGTLERASAGKFVESFVECLQNISNMHTAEDFGIDRYLNDAAVNDTGIPEGLRICGTRIARAIYTIRNKRNIAHKGPLDPNKTDLEFTYYAAGWIMAELIRSSSGIPMDEARRLIDLVSEPVNPLVEEFKDYKLVLASVTVEVEVILLMYDSLPNPVEVQELCRWTQKKSNAIYPVLSKMRKSKLVIGNARVGIKLTKLGRDKATEIIKGLHDRESS